MLLIIKHLYTIHLLFFNQKPNTPASNGNEEKEEPTSRAKLSQPIPEIHIFSETEPLKPGEIENIFGAITCIELLSITSKWHI